MADNRDSLRRQQIFKTITVTPGTPKLSQVVSISEQKLVGNLTLQIEVTGTGTADVFYRVSNNYDKRDGTGDFVKPVSGFNIYNTFSVTSGTDSDGKDHANITMNNAEAFKIEVTATTNPIVISAWLSMQ